jgi:N-acetylmuramoyl-L-alanine amidase
MNRTILALVAATSCLVHADQPVVCIDPGHPSEVGRGTTGRRISEMALVWRVARRLADRLRTDGYRVVLTKSRVDQFVTNRRRAEIANKARANLMLRLHCDASSGSGFTVYYPDRQGLSLGVRGPAPEVLASSRKAALAFHGALEKNTRGVFRDNGLQPDAKTAVGSKQGALTGSVFSKVPVVLVEMCVLTNPKDEALMLSERGMNAMVGALAAAVRAAAGLRSTPQESPGALPSHRPTRAGLVIQTTTL